MDNNTPKTCTFYTPKGNIYRKTIQLMVRHWTRFEFNLWRAKAFYLPLHAHNKPQSGYLVAQSRYESRASQTKARNITTTRSVNDVPSTGMQGSDWRNSQERQSVLATSTRTDIVSWGLCFGKGILKHFLPIIFVIATLSRDMVESNILPQKQFQHHTYYIYLYFC